MSERNKILLKMAHHCGELSALFSQLATLDEPQAKEKEPKSGVIPDAAFKCNHGLEAKRIDGVAKTGKNAGKPYIMHVCPKERKEACDYRIFEDVKEIAQNHVRPEPEFNGDDIPF